MSDLVSVARVRQVRRSVRPVTTAAEPIGHDAPVGVAELVALAPLFAERPRTRGDCAGGPRPCPWVSCRHHLYLDHQRGEAFLKFNFPDLEPWELVETCSLDVADRDGATLDEVGDLLNVTRERARQIETNALLKLRRVSPTPDEVGLDPTASLHRRIAGPRRVPDELREAILADYSAGQLTLRQIAERHGCSVGLIDSIRRERGLEPRRTHPPSSRRNREREREIAKAFREGMSAADLAERFGERVHQVYRILARNRSVP